MSMSTIRMRDILALVVVAAILIAMIPTMVFAADDNSNNSDNISVIFTSGNGAPVVDTVTLYNAGDNATETSMDPTVGYSVQVNVTDNNTLNDLTEVKVTIYYNGSGTYGTVPPNADNKTCGIYTWTPSDNFTMDSTLTAGSWLLGATSAAPTLTASNGTFKFHFTPGRVATESDNTSDEWQIHASVTDNSSQSATNHQEDLNMNWYGQMSITDDHLGLGNLNLGATKQSSPFTVTYWSNGNYSEQVKAMSDNWTGAGSNSLALVTTDTPGAGQFKLVANDENNSSGGDAQALTTTYKTIENGGSITSESGNPESANYLWITLGSSNIPVDTYNGTVYYQILERN